MEILLSWAGFTLFAALRPRFPRPEELSPSVIGLAVREQRQGDLEPQADDQAAHVAHFAAALDKMITRSRSAGTSPETGGTEV